ncbi:UTRA domain-containing protein [Streptomyces aidingensis]|uniref:GntR family transcriptional regulator n=1 Tax=Streptomyces aidingensis TaxID=910347 RepID=A0A1I1VHH5_9ACTN|nr:UTRA domain-containing protein [Streptomyces aidingensis]SFD81468.1 GntR family transcriptional regulator [Streptomyces aidingensis]
MAHADEGNDTPAGTAGERYRRARETGKAYAEGERAEIRHAEVVSAPVDVADALGLETGARVVWRQRLTLRDGRPASLSASWFPASVLELCPRLAQRERIREGTTRYIELKTGRRPQRARDLWSAREAAPEESRALGLPAQATVSEVRHVVYDSDEEPLAFEISIKPGTGHTGTQEYTL